MPEDYTAPTPELAMCAQINFENLAAAVPQIKQHPMWIIAKDQLDAVVQRLQRQKGA